LTSEDHLKQHDAAIAVIWMLFEKAGVPRHVRAGEAPAEDRDPSRHSGRARWCNDAAGLRQALRYYTGNFWYLNAMVAGAARISLDGFPAGTVSAEEAAAAAARLASYKRKRRQAPSTASIPAPPPTPPTPLSAPKQIGLADLRREAQLCKAAAA
jgi:hypothetical protein